jgi:hypothetical protein
MLKSLQRAPDEDAVSFAKRQDPTFVPGEDFPTTVITKAAMQSRKVMEEIAALEAKEKELASQVKMLERAQVLTGSAPKAVTPSRVAAEAKQQRTATSQETEGTEDREVFTVQGRSYRFPPNMNEDQKRAYKDTIEEREIKRPQRRKAQDGSDDDQSAYENEEGQFDYGAVG